MRTGPRLLGGCALLSWPIAGLSPKALPSRMSPHRGLSYSLGARPGQLKGFLAALTTVGSPAIHGTHHSGNTPLPQTSASWLLKGPSEAQGPDLRIVDTPSLPGSWPHPWAFLCGPIGHNPVSSGSGQPFLAGPHKGTGFRSAKGVDTG